MTIHRTTLLTKVLMCPLEGKTILQKLEERKFNKQLIEQEHTKAKLALKAEDDEAELSEEDFVKSRTVRFIASTDSPDRFGDIINQEGWVFTNFRSNPVFLWQHASFLAPIGNSIGEQVNEKGLVMDIFFHGLTEKSLETLTLFKAGVMRAVSVGFRVLETRNIEDEEERSKLGLGRFGTFFEKQELLELSAVTLPANPEALVDDEKSLEDKLLEKCLESEEFVGKVFSKLIEKHGDFFKDFNALTEKVSDLQSKVNFVKTLQNKIHTASVKNDIKSEEEITSEDLSEIFDVLKIEN